MRVYLLASIFSIMSVIVAGFSRICLHGKLNINQRNFVRHLTTTILISGKKNGGENFISDGYDEYAKRLAPTMNVVTHFLKSDAALVEAVKNLGKGKIILLSEEGVEYSSRKFSSFLYDSFEDGGAHVTFVIGGFSGLPNELRKSSFPLISLSKMTFTHQMARLLLIEQIYRATEIKKNSGYHKD